MAQPVSPGKILRYWRFGISLFRYFYKPSPSVPGHSDTHKVRKCSPDQTRHAEGIHLMWRYSTVAAQVDHALLYPDESNRAFLHLIGRLAHPDPPQFLLYQCNWNIHKVLHTWSIWFLLQCLVSLVHALSTWSWLGGWCVPSCIDVPLVGPATMQRKQMPIIGAEIKGSWPQVLWWGASHLQETPRHDCQVFPWCLH